MQYPPKADGSAVSAPPPGSVTGDESSQASGSVPNFDGTQRCAGVNQEYFFPTKGADAHHAVEAAKRLCAGCRFLTACRDYAVPRRSVLGVWGGTTDSERRSLRRRSRELVSA